jgi:hypothetical protein
MRNSNCQNIRREIEEAGSADLLGVAAISHIQGCAACETLSRQQTRLQEIISSLGTVEAPSDFDFRLRARLAAEKQSAASSSQWRMLPLGRGAAAMAATLLLIGSVIVFLSFRTQPVAPVASKQEAPKVVVPDSGTIQNANAPAPDVARNNSTPINAAPRPSERVPKNRGARNELATYRGGKHEGIIESGSTPARSLKRDDALAGTYPTASFPINASYQSLKVSVDDGRGSSRTISLPTVSFGSERTISQNPSPLMASARGSW